MSNSQPAVACGYGVARKEHQRPTTNRSPRNHEARLKPVLRREWSEYRLQAEVPRGLQPEYAATMAGDA